MEFICGVTKAWASFPPPHPPAIDVQQSSCDNKQFVIVITEAARVQRSSSVMTLFLKSLLFSGNAAAVSRREGKKGLEISFIMQVLCL